MRGPRAKPKARFHFTVQKWPVPESSDASLAKKPHLDPKADGCQGGRKSLGGTSPSNTNSRKKGSHGDVTVFKFITSSPSSSSVVHIGTLPKFLDQWRSIDSNRFVLSMVKGHHLQLGCCPLLSCNLRQFNI